MDEPVEEVTATCEADAYPDVVERNRLRSQLQRIAEQEAEEQRRRDRTTVAVRIRVNSAQYLDKKYLIHGILQTLTDTAKADLNFSMISSGQFTFDKTVTLENG